MRYYVSNVTQYPVPLGEESNILIKSIQLILYANNHLAFSILLKIEELIIQLLVRLLIGSETLVSLTFRNCLPSNFS